MSSPRMFSLLQFLADAWYLLLPLALGYAALWTLMPPVRHGAIVVPSFIGVVGLLLGAWWLPAATGVNSSTAYLVLFYLFAGGAIVAGAAMIVQRNPVYAALWFAIVVLNVCGLFLMESAPFLAAATIIIYAGAIIVTFLFVIMLAQQEGLADYDRRSREPALALVAGFLLMGGLIWAIRQSYAVPEDLPRLAKRLGDTYDTFKTNDQVMAKDLVESLRVGDRTVDHVLLVEVDKLPAFARQAPIRQELSDWGAKVGTAVQAGDRATLLAALSKYADIADEVAAAQQRLTGMVSVPPARVAQLSTLSHKNNDPHYVRGLGRTLFGDYLYAVAAAGVLLLVATIGAMVLAQRRPGETL